ncbi:MAG: GIY-YIG nuclease family protein [bacterium]
MRKIIAVYIMANYRNGTLYTGVTSHLAQRVLIHKMKLSKKSFTALYQCTMLVFYEEHTSIKQAIMREKNIKAGSRKEKLMLIETMNPAWRDLFDEINVF